MIRSMIVNLRASHSSRSCFFKFYFELPEVEVRTAEFHFSVFEDVCENCAKIEPFYNLGKG